MSFISLALYHLSVGRFTVSVEYNAGVYISVNDKQLVNILSIFVTLLVFQFLKSIIVNPVFSNIELIFITLFVFKLFRLLIVVSAFKSLNNSLESSGAFTSFTNVIVLILSIPDVFIKERNASLLIS